MRQIMLRLTEDEEKELEEAFEKLDHVMRDVIGWLISSTAPRLTSRLLRDEETTTNKVCGLIGIGAYLTDALAERADSGRSIIASTLSARKIWPHMILPGPKSEFQGMELDQFLDLVEPEDEAAAS